MTDAGAMYKFNLIIKVETIYLLFVQRLAFSSTKPNSDMRPILALLTIALLLTACEGPEGPAGPVGPIGPTGQQGVQGDIGPAGDQGPSGVANIEVFTYTLREVDFSNNDEAGVEIALYEAPLITQTVVDDGVVFAYTNLGLDGLWAPLPYSFDEGEVTQTFIYSVGEFGVLLLRPSGSAPIASFFEGELVRVIVIPPAGVNKLEDVDTSDYDAVIQAVTAPQPSS